MIKGFIFDLDGVLTDTARYHYLAWKRLADELGIPFTLEDNESLRGIPRRESLLRLLNNRHYPEKTLAEMMDRKNNYYVSYIQTMTPADLLPGARELLTDIRHHGLKCALGSASKNARLVLARLHLDALFDAIADGYSVERQKPAPDLFLYAARLLALPPRECVVVEDAAAGIEAARAGGFHTIGIGPVERVGEADVILPGLHAVTLTTLLEKLSARKPS